MADVCHPQFSISCTTFIFLYSLNIAKVCFKYRRCFLRTICAYEPNIEDNMCAYEPNIEDSMCAYEPNIEDSMCAYEPNIEALSHNHCCLGKAIKITYSDVFL